MKYLVILTFIFFAITGKNQDLVNQPFESISKKEDAIDGKKLYRSNCAACHKCDKDFVAPALKGSLERWGYNKKEMYAFIRNPAKSISKNTYAKKHYEKWKANGVMTAFPELSDKELDAIMSYCDGCHLTPLKQ